MEAKDTVMKYEQLMALKFGKECLNLVASYEGAWGVYERLIEIQAEITWDAAFKAGQEDVILETKMGTLTVSSLVSRGRQEVVEFIKESRETPLGTDAYGYYVWESKLEAKLKEWGL